MQKDFYSPTYGHLNIAEVVEQIFDYIREDKEREYEIVVGCDSNSDERPRFPTVVVVLRKKRGGRFFIKETRYPQRKFYNFKERILQEVLLSCQLALDLKEEIQRKEEEAEDILNYSFKYIHADVGENGATKDMVKEIIGLIKGNGFEPKIKPDSFVASSIADRISKQRV